jgi:AhpD family alkylhydroperoxidase
MEQEKLNPKVIKQVNEFTEIFLSEKDNILDKKTIELIATAVSMSVNCIPCTNFHIQEALNNGATKEELNKVFQIVMAVSTGKIKVYTRQLDISLKHE